jgi:hypothetical protein
MWRTAAKSGGSGRALQAHTLTLAIYVHKDEKRMAQAVANLPDLTPSKKMPHAATVVPGAIADG